MDTLRYVLFLVLILVACWAISRLWKIPKLKVFLGITNTAILVLLLVEMGCSTYYRLSQGHWIFNWSRNLNSLMFESDPYLVVRNRKNISIERDSVKYTHDNRGNRISYIGDASKASFRISTIGGSTTYGVGVSDSETWPYILDSLTGSDTAVVNYGIPGHTTAEHLSLAAICLNEFRPDMIILHVGLNDLRLSNVLTASDDYAEFQAPHLFGSMGLCHLEKLPRVASLFYLVKTAQTLKLYPVCPYHSMHYELDHRVGVDSVALSRYARNLRKLLYLCRYYTDNILVVPQVLNHKLVSGNELKWWIPGIEGRDLFDVMSTYNRETRKTAVGENCQYADSIGNRYWKEDEFADAGHLNKNGNVEFAKILAFILRRQ